MMYQCLGDRYEAEAIEYFTPNAGVLNWLDELTEAEIESSISALHNSEEIAEDQNNWDDYEDYLSEIYSELAEIYEKSSSEEALRYTFELP